jgi:hypothetical protein
MTPFERREGMRMRMFPSTLWTWAFLALGILSPLAAQISQPTPFAAAGLRLSVDRRELKVGESLTLTLEFKQVSSGAQVQTGEPEIATPVNFEIGMRFSNSRIEIVDQVSQVVTSTRLKLTATRPGEEKLGPARLIFEDATGQKHEIESNTALVTVLEKTPLLGLGKKKAAAPKPTTVPVPTPQDELRDLKPLLSESHWFLWTLFWIALLGAVGGFAWRIWRRHQANLPAAPVPLEDATRLREAWRKLGKEDLSSEEFCLGLSTLVRECLQVRYGFNAPDLTTEEILEDLRGVKLFKDDLEATEKCLKACDRVLYAEGNLTGRDALRSAAQGLLPKTLKS